MSNDRRDVIDDDALRAALQRRSPRPGWAAGVARRAVHSGATRPVHHRWRLALAAAVLALVAGVATGIAWQRHRQALQAHRTAIAVRQLQWALKKAQEQMSQITGQAVRDGLASLSRVSTGTD